MSQRGNNLRYLSTSAPVALGSVVGKGGEGVVWEIAGGSQFVAKIYERAPEAEKVAKLRSMILSAEPSLLAVAAWPTDLIVDQRNIPRGFAMPRVVSRKNVHELYSPKSRAEEFPEVDFRFLVHVGKNMARAIELVHSKGHVIGDINHGSILVSRDGTVSLIDCDSFQIVGNGRTYTCDVGVPLFTPPELHGVSFRGLPRTPNHDAFGLSVLLFQLLFLGRHPFAGRFLGADDMSIERAIAEFRFAYGPRRRAFQMESPPHTLPLESMGADVAGLFEESFGPGGPARRPTPIEWISALDALSNSLARCSAARSHYYPNVCGSCIWCGLEKATGRRLFGHLATTTPQVDPAVIAELWRQVELVESPGAAPDVWSMLACPPEEKKPGKWLRAICSLLLMFGGVGGCVALQSHPYLFFMVFVAGLLAWPHNPTQNPSLLAAALKAWTDALRQWEQEAGEAQFAEHKALLAEAKAKLAGSPQLRARLTQQMADRQRDSQLASYLDRYRIDGAGIPMIGEGRAAKLASYGVETALDVTREAVSAIPGFGAVITDQLVAWRQGHERNFQFNPNQPLDAKSRAKIEGDLQAFQDGQLHLLRSGPEKLRDAVEKAVSARQRLAPELQAVWIRKCVAERQSRAGK